MNKQTEALKLAQDLRALAERLSEGWHEGIKIDASDIVLLLDAAQALAEQPEQQQKPTCKQNLQVEELLKDMLDTLPYNSPNYWIGRIKEVMPLYTSPPASKPWVGLTDKEKKEIYRLSVYVEGAISLTEAKLREKNNG